MRTITAATFLVGVLSSKSAAQSRPQNDRAIVSALDVQYQAAVKANDAEAMNRIFADDFILVTGRGDTATKSDLIKSARNKDAIYERQDETNQTVRMYGSSTAVVTALLWLKGTRNGQPFDYKLWFSDTYVKSASGWHYAFGQASLRLSPP